MRYLFLIVLSLVTIISCSNEAEPQNEYEKFLSEVPRVPVQDSLRIVATSSPTNSSSTSTTDIEGRAIVVNSSVWTIHLMDDEGNFLAQAGGPGRGPGEHTAINQIHLGADSLLYVFDARSREITAYTIVNNDFQLEQELVLPAYKNRLYLETIHKQEQGFVGVFKPLGAADYTFKVYRLDEDLELKNLLFEMPGNETYTVRGRPRENFLGRITQWATIGDSFYYAHTVSLSVTTVNLQDGTTTLVEVPNVPQPVKGEEEVKAMEEQFALTIQNNPTFQEVILDGQYLQSFKDFIPGKNYFYYELRRPGKANGILLRINRTTKEIEKIIVPHGFSLFSVNGNTLFGIDFTDRKNELMVLKL